MSEERTAIAMMADLLTVETLMGVYTMLHCTRETARERLSHACKGNALYLDWFDMRWPEGS